jgi:hypothetical protein
MPNKAANIKPTNDFFMNLSFDRMAPLPRHPTRAPAQARLHRTIALQTFPAERRTESHELPVRTSDASSGIALREPATGVRRRVDGGQDSSIHHRRVRTSYAQLLDIRVPESVTWRVREGRAASLALVDAEVPRDRRDLQRNALSGGVATP